MSTSHIVSQSQQEFNKAIDHLRSELSRLQIGRANAGLVENIKVEAYGSSQPLKSVASVVIPDARTIQIQCWDKSLLGEVEKAIQISDIGIHPVNDGVYIRLNIPPLTEERRKELVKVVNKYAEEARIAVRSARQSMNSKFDEMKKNKEITDDEYESAKKQVQEKVDVANKLIDEVAKKKESELMTI